MALLSWIVCTGNARAGIDVWTSNGPEGATVTSLAVAPSSPSTLYVGTVGGGGVFKSTNGGATWTARNNGLLTEASVLAVDPSDASTVYAGGQGVYKSTDGGGSWTRKSAGLYSYGLYYGLMPTVSSLAVNPSNPATVYAGTEGDGVYRTADGGETWAPVNRGLPYEISPNGAVSYSAGSAVVLDPSNPATLYASMRGWGGGSAGIYKSTDGGASWTAAANNGLTARGIYVLAIDPLNPATIYAGTDRGVFKSTDSGASWVAVNNGIPGSIATIDSVAVEPSNPSTLYAGTMGWGGGSAGIYRSRDGGGSWMAVYSGAEIGPVAVDPSTPSTVYAGVKPSEFDSGGVLKSTDGGASWQALHSGLTNTDVRGVAVDPSNPSILYAGLWRGVSKSVDGGASWTQNGLGRFWVNSVAVDLLNPSTIYAGGSDYDNVHHVYTYVYKSTDGGVSWAAASSGFPAFIPGSAIRCLAIDPSNPSTLYAGGRGDIYKSTDGAGSWVALNSGLGGVYALVMHPSTPGTLYAGTVYESPFSGGGVFKTTDGGASWTAINNGLTELDVLSLTLDPSNPSTLYAGTAGRGVFKSTDGGANWTAVNSGLFEIPFGYSNPYVYALAVAPTSPATVYAAASGFGAGVFKSTDGGQSWAFMWYGLPLLPNGYTNMEAQALAVAPSNPSIVYAGTGRGGVFAIEQVCSTANSCVCGDGSVSPAVEQCDDGNSSDADTCKANCTLNVCGDGIVQEGVEECDGEPWDGHGCSSTCQSELAPGRGAATNTCALEWLTHPVSTRNRTGVPMGVVRCTDDDPTCDSGLTAGDGVCTFPVQLWFNVADSRLPRCTPSDIARVELLSPNEAAPRSAFDETNRDAFEEALVALGGAVSGQCAYPAPARGQLCEANADCDSAPDAGDGRCRGRFVAFDPPLSDVNNTTDFVSIQVPQGTTKQLRVRVRPSNDPITGRPRRTDTNLLALNCRLPQ